MKAASVGVGLVLSLSACSDVEETGDGYEPARLDAVAGSELKRVTLTEEGARRTGLRTATIGDDGTVPYDALIYDARGTSYVYTATEPLSFVRAKVVVDLVKGDRARLARGPPPGTEVVTVGAAEVYGAELEISGGH